MQNHINRNSIDSISVSYSIYRAERNTVQNITAQDKGNVGVIRLLSSANRFDKPFIHSDGVIMPTMVSDGTHGLNFATQGEGNEGLVVEGRSFQK